MKPKFSLKIKSILIVLMIALVLSGTAIFISYRVYATTMDNRYRTTAMDLAKTAAALADPDAVAQYAEQMMQIYRADPMQEPETDEELAAYYARYDDITGDAYYSVLYKALDSIKSNNGDVLYLYLFVLDPDTKTGVYLIDIDASEYACPMGTWDIIYEGNYAVFEDPTIGFPAYISNSEYGWLCSAGAPVYGTDGSVIAYAMIDVSMDEVMADREAFLENILLIMVIATLVLALLLMWIINRIVVRPINSLSFAAASFVSDQKADGEVSAISQLDIRTSDEIQNLSESIKRMERDINQYIEDLGNVTAEKERIGAELDIARHIQASMLPCIFPAFPERNEIDIYATMNPAKEVGGDFYDFFMVDDRHLAIVMADVSGKGVPAALFMVIGKTLIKDHTTPGSDLGTVFTEVNNLLCESNSEELFITAFEGVLDLVTGEFVYVNAGHEMPFICKAGGDFEPYKIRAAFVLAGMENMRYRAGSMTLEPGDKIFQYTDGVTEATNSHNELYGMERLTAILNQVKNQTPSGILPAVKADVDAFVGEAPQFDDITMLCLEYKARMEPKEDDR